MRSYQHLYQQHEYPTTPTKDLRQRIVEIVKGLWFSGNKFLTAANEPQFNEVVDEYGITCWQVYDPASDRTFYLSSHQAVLEWVEERHSHNWQTSSFFDLTESIQLK